MTDFLLGFIELYDGRRNRKIKHLHNKQTLYKLEFSKASSDISSAQLMMNEKMVNTCKNHLQKEL